MVLGKILYVVPDDTTEATTSWQVMQLARAAHAEVILMAVRQPRWWPFGAQLQREQIGDRLAEVAARMKGYASEVHVVDGEPVAAALRVLRQARAGLVMMGAGERSLEHPTHVDGAVLEIARQAPTDAWICKPNTDPQVKHVLCAADTTPGAGAALRCAVDLSRWFKARLKLLSVMPEPTRQPPEDVEPGIESQHQAQKEFIDGFDLKGVSLTRSVVWARDPASEVLHEAELNPDGVLVLGASSRVRHGGLGMTSEPVLRRCPSSVWIVRRPAVVRRSRAAVLRAGEAAVRLPAGR